jgi:PAS domain S-box-containing protein
MKSPGRRKQTSHAAPRKGRAAPPAGGEPIQKRRVRRAAAAKPGARQATAQTRPAPMPAVDAADACDPCAQARTEGADAALRAVLAKTTAAALALSGAEPGRVFEDLARGLASALAVQATLVAEFTDPARTRMRTLAAVIDGKALRSFEYDVALTPCRHIVGRESRFVASGVHPEFQPGTIFSSLGFDSYAGYSLLGADGEQIGLIVALDRRPIQDRELTEALLKIFAARAAAEIERDRAESSHRAIFEASQDAIFVHDWDTGAILDVNPKAAQAYGYSRQEMRYLSVADISSNVPPYTADQAARYLEQARSGAPVRFEWHRRNRDGSLHWDEVCLKEVVIGARRRILAFTHEVTERRNAELALRASEEQYRSIFNASADQMLLRDENLRIVDANSAFLRVHGVRHEDLVDRVLPMFALEPQRAESEAMLRRALAGESGTLELQTRAADGTVLDVEVRAMPMLYQGRPHVLAIARDITMERRAEAALRASEEQTRAIFNASADAMVVRDERMRIVDVNAAFLALRGMTRDELVGQPHPVFTVEPHRAEAEKLLREALAGHGGKIEVQTVAAGGAVLDIEVRATPMRYQGRPHVLAIARDITVERRAQAALRASEEQYRAIFNASADGLFLRDARFRIVDVNPAYLAMKGFTREELLGTTRIESQFPHDELDRRSAHERALAGETVRYETSAVRKDGTWFDVEVRGMPVLYRGQPHVLYSVRDITDVRKAEAERRALEAQLLQAQKMEAIGQLTGGIAHDFNNILASIMGYIVLATERIDSADPRTAGYLEQSLASCRRARDLIQQMLTFSRGGRGEPRPVELAELVEDAAPLLRSSLPSTVALQLELNHDAPPVFADEVQAGQVLLNLAINARDAMHESGTLKVAVQPRYLQAGYCASCRTPLSGSFVELSVGDTGSGIDPAVLGRMFEPFYSTKETGKGSGMGLAMVHGIVHEHGGHIVVETERYRGSTFRILLPSLAEPDRPAAAGRAARVTNGARTHLSGSVLLVDDEEAVRGFMRELLESWGLRVTAAGNAEQALAAFERAAGTLDVVITDQTMPSGTGVELADLLLARQHGLPVLLYSGRADAFDHDALRARGIVAVLEKPVDVGILRQALEAHLPRGGAAGATRAAHAAAASGSAPAG